MDRVGKGAVSSARYKFKVEGVFYYLFYQLTLDSIHFLQRKLTDAKLKANPG